MDSKKSVKAVLAALAVTSLFTSVNTIYAADQSQDKAKDKNAENAVKGQANQDSLYNMVALLDGTKTKSTATTTAPVATTAANVKADAPKEDATTDTQNSVTNNQGFYVQQDTTNGGTAGVYNSLTKDGLWVGGTSDDTGFHVDNTGSVTITDKDRTATTTINNSGLTTTDVNAKNVNVGNISIVTKEDGSNDIQITNRGNTTGFVQSGMTPGQVYAGKDGWGYANNASDDLNSAAIGGGSVRGKNSLAVGGASVDTRQATAPENLDVFENADSTAVGRQALVNGLGSTAVGTRAQANKNYSVAVGTDSQAAGDNAVAIGSGALANDNSVVIGSGRVGDLPAPSLANGVTNVTAVGTNTEIDSNYGTALGYGANVAYNSEKSVALGSDSFARTGEDGTPVVSFGHSVGDQNGLGGMYNDELNRKLTHVADGTVAEGSTDAVTGGQLFTVKQKADNSVQYDNADKSSVTFGGREKGTALKNVNDIVFNVAYKNTYGFDKQGTFSFVDAGVIPGKVLTTGKDNFALGTDAVIGYDTLDGSAESDKPAPNYNVVVGNHAAIDGGVSSSVVIGNSASAKNWKSNEDGTYPELKKIVAIGQAATADHSNATSIGAAASVGGTNGTALGAETEARADNSTAVGGKVMINGDAENSVAIGGDSYSEPNGTGSIQYSKTEVAYGAANSTIVGVGAYSQAKYGTSLGADTKVSSENGLALGAHARVNFSGKNSVALGANSEANDENVVSVGNEDENLQRKIVNVADGVDAHDAVNKGQLDTLSSNAVQYDKNEDGTTNYGSITFKGAGEDVGTNLKNIGTITAANGWFYLNSNGKVSTYDLALSDGGEYNSFKDAGLVAGKVTAPASYNTFDNLVIGSGAKIDNMDTENGFAKQNTAVGNKAQILPGWEWGEDSEGKVTVERANSVSGSSAFGAGAQVTGNNSSAYGSSANVVNNLGVAIGYNAKAGKSSSKADDGKATAVGAEANAGGNSSTALGYYAQATVDKGTAVGANTSLGYGTEGSVALGANSKVDSADLLKDKDGKVTETNGVVSVGDSNYGTNSKDSFQRRIINVADGVNKFDAVNKQQLDVVDTKVTGLSDSAVQYDKTTDGKDTDYNSITLKGKAWQGTDIKNVGDIILAGKTTYGQDLSYAKAGITPGYGSDLSKNGIVSLRGNATGMNAIAIGTDADASQLSSISIGARAHSAAEYGVALGEGTWIDPVDQKATVKGDKGSVALGAGSTVTKSDTQNGTIGVVSVGSGDKDSRYGATRKIINVTDGTIAKDSHDAVTGGQLYTEQEARKDADQVFTNAFAAYEAAGITPGTVNDGDYNVALGNGATVTGGNANTAIGEGTTVDGAYNVALGNGASTQNGAENSIAIGYFGEANAKNSIAIGQSAKANKDKATAIGYNTNADYQGVALGANANASAGNGVAIGSDSIASGVNSTALGYASKATGSQATALGQNAQALAEQSVALGEDSIATEKGTVSVGNGSWLSRRIVNVADGVNAHDAATVGQIKDLAGVDATKGATVQYDLNSDKTTNYGSATFAGVTQKVNGKDVNVGTKLNNVNDIALNVQVYETEADKYAPKADPSIGSYGLITETNTLAGYESRSLAGAGLLPGKVSGELDTTKGKGYNVALGRTTSIDGSHSGSIAVGRDATVIFDDKFNKEPNKGTESPNDAISIGTRTKNYNSFSGVALGASSGTWQSNWGTALGTDSHVDNSYYGTAAGVFAKVENSAEGLALGRSAYVKGAPGSVALGSKSVADEENVISVGHKADDLRRDGKAYGDDLKRRITNVADGKDANDAATYGQLTTLQNKVNGLATPGLKTGSLDDTSAKNGSVALGTESKITGASNSIAIGRATIDQSGVKNEGVTGEGPWNAIAIGGDNTSVKNSENGIALGAYAEVTNSKWGTALGSGTTVRDSEESLAIGHNAKVINAYKSTAVGYGASALDTAFQSAAFGPSATVKGFNTVALGSQSFASGENSVALGSDSVAAEDKVISVGHKKGDKDASGFGYQDDLFRKVTNVANGTSDHDAVTVGQFKGANDSDFLKAVGKLDWKYAADKAEKFNKLAADVASGKFDNLLKASSTFDVSKISALSLAADVPTSILKEQTNTTAAGTTDKRNPETGSGSTGGWTTTGTETTTNGNVTVNGKLSANGGLDVGTTDKNADLNVHGNATVDKTLNVKGDLMVGEGDKAINVGKTLQDNQAAIEQNQKDIASLGTSVASLGDEVDSVGAISAALAGLHPLDYGGKDSKFQISAALGSYDGTRAAALGGFYNANRDTLISFGVSTNLNGDARKTAANIGATFRVGQGNSKEIPDDVASLRDEVVSLKAENATYKDRMDEMEKQLQELLKASKKN